MANNIYITASESKSGKSAIILGMMQLLLKRLRKVAIFRPIINMPLDPKSRDHDINLILEHFGLNIPYEDTYAYTIDVARELINSGQRAVLFETILKKYKKLEENYDFVLCEGTDFAGKDPTFEFELNAEIAANLGCPVVLVANAAEKTADEILDSTQSTLDLMADHGLDLIACLINRSTLYATDAKYIAESLSCHSSTNALLTYVLPEEPLLGRPTVADIRKWLNGRVLFGEKRLDNLVSRYLVAAMQVGNFLEYLTPDSLIITPGDRGDIVLASIASSMSPAFPEVSGIVLTGGIDLHPSIQRMLNSWSGIQIPVITAEGHTFQTMQVMTQLYGKIEPGDLRKINTGIGHFERHVDGEKIASRVVNRKSSKITPKMFEYNLLEKAKRNKMRIVLPEGQEERILRAADALLRREVAEIIILGNPEQIAATARNCGLDLTGASIINPEHSPEFEDYVNTYFELRKHKGISTEQARDLMLDPTYYGTMMVHKGDADGMVSGAINTTAHTIRPAFEIIRTKSKGATVSSVFLMCLKDRVLVFGDCAVVPNPNPQELANIAISSAETAAIFGIEPRVAMLSYSTGASGKGEDVDKVKEATAIAKELAPELLLEGPLQYDAAIDPQVAETKMPGNPVAGKASVFIFPDLNTGNNTYKAVQRAADAVAIGPVLQGLNKPVNDLSRGSTVEDIINTVAITAIQAQAVKEAESKK
ncbi:phosphate acetyltransferase [Desulfovibrio sp. OttesenSCG-928-F07]|nr:phosphate acetyltransferase [Desulfovibrio sp. OttesenSCG-928-F07]